MTDFHLLHPIFIHFTVGIYLVLTFTESIGYFRKNEIYFSLSSQLWIAFTLFSILSVATGLIAKSSLNLDSTTFQTLNYHENSGLFFLLFSLVLGFFRLQHSKKTKSKQINLILLTGIYLNFLIMILTGFFGGKLVYWFGVGVKSGL